MTYDVMPDPESPEQQNWMVVAVNRAGSGEIYTTIFLGHDAEKRAQDYAAWKRAAEVPN